MAFSSHYSLWLILASYFRTTVRNGYNTVLLDKMYDNLRIWTYIVKWDVPCMVFQFKDEHFLRIIPAPDVLYPFPCICYPTKCFLIQKNAQRFSVNSPHGRFIFPSICRDINFRVPVTSGSAHVRYILYSSMPSLHFKRVN